MKCSSWKWLASTMGQASSSWTTVQNLQISVSNCRVYSPQPLSSQSQSLELCSGDKDKPKTMTQREFHNFLYAGVGDLFKKKKGGGEQTWMWWGFLIICWKPIYSRALESASERHGCQLFTLCILAQCDALKAELEVTQLIFIYKEHQRLKKALFCQWHV